MHSLKQEIKFRIISQLYTILSQNEVKKQITQLYQVVKYQQIMNYTILNCRNMYLTQRRFQQYLKIVGMKNNIALQIQPKKFMIFKLHQLQILNYQILLHMIQIKINLIQVQQNEGKFEILIEGKTNNQDNILSYKMRVNSFLCQFDEFYTSGSCQSDQGFYSKPYKNTKCSIFDKTKFDAITANQIQLKVGYWRQNHISDY
ncbi:unnamed protein product [Paramecium sonneborni]|uniref:Uncharacterized protein n=1 Tax=Paramecium sonneborni TaxID=65129 RepID=A0A8S1PR97_9CILI|nr:unnamed protein product [Paramecium sonneborni]